MNSSKVLATTIIIGLLNAPFAWAFVVPSDDLTMLSAEDVAKSGALAIQFEGKFANLGFDYIAPNLARQNIIDMEEYDNQAGESLNEILFRLKRLPTKQSLPEFEKFLCEVNKHVCSVDDNLNIIWRIVKSTEQSSPPSTKHPPDYDFASIVKGTQIERARDCRAYELEPHILCLPRFELQTYPTVEPVEAVESDQLRNMAFERGGCLRPDIECSKTIRSMNNIPESSEDVFFSARQKTRKPTLLIPVKGFRLQIVVRKKEDASATLLLVSGVTLYITVTEGVPKDKVMIYVTAPSRVSAQNGAVLAQKKTYDYKRPLNAMSYPADLELKDYQTVTIGVWDFRVDTIHCNLEAGMLVVFPPYGTPSGQIQEPARLECGSERAYTSDIWDHATHIAGILSARPKNAGIVGANPKARLWVYDVANLADSAVGSTEPVDQDPIAKYLKANENSLLGIINLSQSFSGFTALSTINGLIRKFHNLILFVVSAGNDGLSFKAGEMCPIQPACSSGSATYKDGMISVVALDSLGQHLLPNEKTPNGGQKCAHNRPFCTNHGTAFDVAAVGTAVSTFHGDSFGVMEGTSVAAPYVAGLASLLYAKTYANLISEGLLPTPRKIKERILFTADFSEELDTWVHFGKINYQMALSLERDVLAMKSSTCGLECTPLWSLNRDSGTSITIAEGFVEGQRKRNLSIPVKNIRRIFTNKDAADSQDYWIIFRSESGLTKISRAKFPNGATLDFLDGNNSPKSVTANHIKNFVACSMEPNCEEEA
jgi:hypothetical protein